MYKTSGSLEQNFVAPNNLLTRDELIALDLQTRNLNRKCANSLEDMCTIGQEMSKQEQRIPEAIVLPKFSGRAHEKPMFFINTCEYEFKSGRVPNKQCLLKAWYCPYLVELVQRICVDVGRIRCLPGEDLLTLTALHIEDSENEGGRYIYLEKRGDIFPNYSQRDQSRGCAYYHKIINSSHMKCPSTPMGSKDRSTSRDITREKATKDRISADLVATLTTRKGTTIPRSRQLGNADARALSRLSLLHKIWGGKTPNLERSEAWRTCPLGQGRNKQPPCHSGRRRNWKLHLEPTATTLTENPDKGMLQNNPNGPAQVTTGHRRNCHVASLHEGGNNRNRILFTLIFGDRLSLNNCG
ncbi:hypothetical protein PR048_001620 [Dryococelus australis]|uniref:Uncharacterized protein n=1 Tax=Dryococelus australis TaxID=614101 RepID=A0ABQ9II11_9NEOP|nr:hypothetical protein PR048_001620 [Dryococelus australis]